MCIRDRIGTVPLLTADEELDLAQRKADGDEFAKERLIEANLRLVVSIATVSYTHLDVYKRQAFWSLTDAGREETCCWDILTENVCFMVWRDVSIILTRRKVNHITLTR